MRPESSNDAGSVPAGVASVKSALAVALSGCPVRVRSLSLDVSVTATSADLVEVCSRLFRVGENVNVTVQFCLGDANEHTGPWSPERKALRIGITKALGAAYAERLGAFGRVSKRWPPDRRSDKYCWEFYRTHRPGEPGKPDVLLAKKPVELTEVSSEVVAGCEVLTMEGASKQRYILRRQKREAV